MLRRCLKIAGNRKIKGGLRMKKLLSLVLTLMLVLGCTSFAGAEDVINLYAFTDEVPTMLQHYIDTHPEFGYKLNTTIIATTDGLYQPALDQALTAGGADAPDIYCAEAAFILKYAQGDMASYAAAYDDLGIDTANAIKAADIAQYTVDIGTRPADGKVVGLGYQATGGAFIYRRSIAKDVWGTDDPAVIATKIGPGWDKFFEAAEELKAKGYGIVSGDGDIWHAIENSSDKGWIVDGELYIDPAREAFMDMSKKLKDNGYHNDTTDWSDAWFADMKDAGAKKIFGFYGPAWLINYTIGPNAGDTAGDWAICTSIWAVPSSGRISTAFIRSTGCRPNCMIFGPVADIVPFSTSMRL